MFRVDASMATGGSAAIAVRTAELYAPQDEVRGDYLTRLCKIGGKCRYCGSTLTDALLARTPEVCGSRACKARAKREGFVSDLAKGLGQPLDRRALLLEAGFSLPLTSGERRAEIAAAVERRREAAPPPPRVETGGTTRRPSAEEEFHADAGGKAAQTPQPGPAAAHGPPAPVTPEETRPVRADAAPAGSAPSPAASHELEAPAEDVVRRALRSLGFKGADVARVVPHCQGSTPQDRVKDALRLIRAGAPLSEILPQPAPLLASGDRLCSNCLRNRVTAGSKRGICRPCRDAPLKHRAPEVTAALADPRRCACGCRRVLRADNTTGWSSWCVKQRYAAGERPPRKSRANAANEEDQVMAIAEKRLCSECKTKPLRKDNESGICSGCRIGARAPKNGHTAATTPPPPPIPGRGFL